MTYRVLDLPRRAKDLKIVDCGTCPVTMACAINRGGNGHTFDCCGATGVVVENEDAATLLMIDCGAHKFERDDDYDSTQCPLCSSDALKAELLGLGTPARWVPTVHARVAAETRLTAWRTALPEAREYVEGLKRRKGEP